MSPHPLGRGDGVVPVVILELRLAIPPPPGAKRQRTMYPYPTASAEFDSQPKCPRASFVIGETFVEVFFTGNAKFFPRSSKQKQNLVLNLYLYS